MAASLPPKHTLSTLETLERRLGEHQSSAVFRDAGTPPEAPPVSYTPLFRIDGVDGALRTSRAACVPDGAEVSSPTS